MAYTPSATEGKILSNMSDAGIEVSNVTSAYGKAAPIFENVSFSVDPAESVALMGPSGVGKSTVLSLVLGLLSPTRGTVAVAGQDWSGLSRSKKARHRAQHIGMVFQFGELVDELSPAENVALPLLWSTKDGQGALDKSEALLEQLGVSTQATTADVVSGGERQRIAVARALIADPPVVLADEPTGSLDSESADTLADLLFALPKERGCALLVVTHSVDIAARADRVLRLTREGIICGELG